MKKTSRIIASLLLAAMLVTGITACGDSGSKAAGTQPSRPAVTEPVAIPDKPDTTPAVTEPVTTPVTIPSDTDDLSEKPSDGDAAADEPAVENAPVQLDPASVQGVARLKDLVGNWAMDLYFSDMGKYIVVNTEDEHNPYDLTWRYGPETEKRKEVEDPEWDALYRSYVDACDWSLVFDAEYYKKAFPMLAKLYHDNDALLLEHFQTQGVHEGRQASASFNVAAYMANCDKALVEAFGEDYECYYFYYMLNQESQNSVDTANKNGIYPRWLTLELSLQQSKEYRMVNSYRREVDAQPVEQHPEIIALSNYRAWYDAEHNMYAHDWTKSPETADDVNDCLWRTGRDHFAENTVKWYHTDNRVSYSGFHTDYRNSESHYEAMVSEKYFYSGYSNPYFSDNPDNPFANDAKGEPKTGYVAQFDSYTEKMPHSPYENELD